MYDRTKVLIAITQAFENKDLSFIETVNSITFGYKVQLKQNLTNLNNGKIRN